MAIPSGLIPTALALYCMLLLGSLIRSSEGGIKAFPKRGMSISSGHRFSSSSSRLEEPSNIDGLHEQAWTEDNKKDREQKVRAAVEAHDEDVELQLKEMMEAELTDEWMEHHPVLDTWLEEWSKEDPLFEPLPW
ncbi:hypothetical protein KP509_38G052300 [Ceratopteris richardii]|nr:hypothetical protein KP509_38G052300 [Ceratopteris richardii]